MNGVLDTIKVYRSHGIWIELTTCDPGYNDTDEEIRSIARFINNELGAETPWHVSAFLSTYKLTDAPRTPAKTLQNAREIGIEEGQVCLHGEHPGQMVKIPCWSCKTRYRRYGYTISEYNIKNRSCTFCGIIDGVGIA